MKINLQSVNYYFLTCNNPRRKKHILNEFKNFNLIEVNPLMNIGKNKSGISGFSKILDLASQNQIRNKPFQPFVIFEESCSLSPTDLFAESIVASSVPEDTTE